MNRTPSSADPAVIAAPGGRTVRRMRKIEKPADGAQRQSAGRDERDRIGKRHQRAAERRRRDHDDLAQRRVACLHAHVVARLDDVYEHGAFRRRSERAHRSEGEQDGEHQGKISHAGERERGKHEGAQRHAGRAHDDDAFAIVAIDGMAATNTNSSDGTNITSPTSPRSKGR